MKWKHLGTLLSVKRSSEKHNIERIRAHDGITLCPDDISFNAERRTVAKLCRNNICGKFAHIPNRTIKEFITELRRVYHFLSDDGFEVSDVHHKMMIVCMCPIRNQNNFIQTPSLNTTVIIASYATTHARLELYIYFEHLKDRALYCDTDSVIYKHIVGEYNPPLSEFVGGMTDELGGSHITEYVSNGLKNMQSVQQMVNRL